MDTPPLLHIYSPLTHHDEAHIVGTKSALLKLRSAIDSALKNEVGVESAYIADGEGFDIVVVRTADDWDDFMRYDDPYVDRFGEADLEFKHPDYPDELLTKVRNAFQADN